ncbi:MAG TPA: twin-arginine translocase TatA/TatE family subunit [Anaerolineae bacterium]|nr:twin-arginine translocase TatA/TatE family subunit [Anaerolineae bacterium]HIP71351.1 twin-arginine translocase TatA/TatE family subunit [Anaerolineae bacterium]
MGRLGTSELLLILAVVVFVFGVGRISKIGGELGKGIQAFRQGINEGKGKNEEAADDSGSAEKSEEAESEIKA